MFRDAGTKFIYKKVIFRHIYNFMKVANSVNEIQNNSRKMFDKIETVY